MQTAELPLHGEKKKGTAAAKSRFNLTCCSSQYLGRLLSFRHLVGVFLRANAVPASSRAHKVHHRLGIREATSSISLSTHRHCTSFRPPIPAPLRPQSGPSAPCLPRDNCIAEPPRGAELSAAASDLFPLPVLQTLKPPPTTTARKQKHPTEWHAPPYHTHA